LAAVSARIEFMIIGSGAGNGRLVANHFAPGTRLVLEAEQE
jgi:hypothetical protein